MFECTIELLDALKTTNNEPKFLVVGRYGFNPGIHEGDEIYIDWTVWGKDYQLKSKVVGRKREVYPPSDQLNSRGQEAVEKGLFLLRIFVEAEDRDAIIELSEAIAKNNL